MRILAIDTSLSAISVCLYDGDGRAVIAGETVPMERGHAEALLPLVEDVIHRVRSGFSRVDKVAVTVGPGSFTGIRVGISAAKGFGIALEAPVVGVSTLSAFASQVVLEGGEGVIVPSIEARADQVYVQVVAPDGKVLQRAHIAKPLEFVERLGNRRVRFTGPAASRLILDAWSVLVPADVAGSFTTPSIECVARQIGRAHV